MNSRSTRLISIYHMALRRVLARVQFIISCVASRTTHGFSPERNVNTFIYDTAKQAVKKKYLIPAWEHCKVVAKI